MYPFPMTMGLGASYPVPMQQMGLGQTPPQQQQQMEPVIDGVSGWGHVGLGALVGLAAGWFFFKK